jgi:hypothetical protein
VKSTDHKIPRYLVFFITLLPRRSRTQISSSTPYSRTPAACLPPSVCETKFHTHTKQQVLSLGQVTVFLCIRLRRLTNMLSSTSCVTENRGALDRLHTLHCQHNLCYSFSLLGNHRTLQPVFMNIQERMPGRMFFLCTLGITGMNLTANSHTSGNHGFMPKSWARNSHVCS